MKKYIYFALLWIGYMGLSYADADNKITALTTVVKKYHETRVHDVQVSNDLETVIDYLPLDTHDEQALRQVIRGITVSCNNRIIEHGQKQVVPIYKTAQIALELNTKELLALFDHPNLIETVLEATKDNPVVSNYLAYIVKKESNNQIKPTILAQVVGRILKIKVTFSYAHTPGPDIPDTLSLFLACIHKIDQWNANTLKVEVAYSPFFTMHIALIDTTA
jgi:hypothetical protein